MSVFEEPQREPWKDAVEPKEGTVFVPESDTSIHQREHTPGNNHEELTNAIQRLDEGYVELENKTGNVEKKSYSLETGETIFVTSKAFTPNEKRGETEPVDEHVIFLPGWAMSADSDVVSRLGQSYSERSKNVSYVLSTETNDLPDSEIALYREAEAIAKFISEKGLTDVVIAGHSQGGSKAIDLVSILQNNPDIQVNGLILIDSMGLYEQDPLALARGFAKDSIINTPKTLTKKTQGVEGEWTQSLKALQAIVTGIGRKVRMSGLSSPSIVKSEVKAMAQVNPRMKEIAVPTILITGAEDPISHPEKIIPPSEEAELVAQWESEDASDKVPYRNAREEYLKQNQFPQSPYVRMIAPEKFGHHGLPFFRSESVAEATLYMLKRAKRESQELPTS
jgi:pimeloyl-ACP methyl ester carboxylesterase